MPGAGVRIDVEWQDAEARQSLARMVARLDDPAPIFDEIGAMLVTSTQARFEAERGPDGRDWLPSQRARKEGGKQTLAFNARGNRFASRKSTARRRSGVIRIALAAIGFYEVEMPARPFLGVDEGDRAEILRILEDALTRAAA